MNFWKVVHKPVEEKRVTKASEYADIVRREKLEFKANEKAAGYITTDGWLELCDHCLQPDEALAFANWILETFQ